MNWWTGGGGKFWPSHHPLGHGRPPGRGSPRPRVGGSARLFSSESTWRTGNHGRGPAPRVRARVHKHEGYGRISAGRPSTERYLLCPSDELPHLSPRESAALAQAVSAQRSTGSEARQRVSEPGRLPRHRLRRSRTSPRDSESEARGASEVGETRSRTPGQRPTRPRLTRSTAHGFRPAEAPGRQSVQTGDDGVPEGRRTHRGIYGAAPQCSLPCLAAPARLPRRSRRPGRRASALCVDYFRISSSGPRPRLLFAIPSLHLSP